MAMTGIGSNALLQVTYLFQIEIVPLKLEQCDIDYKCGLTGHFLKKQEMRHFIRHLIIPLNISPSLTYWLSFLS